MKLSMSILGLASAILSAGRTATVQKPSSVGPSWSMPSMPATPQGVPNTQRYGFSRNTGGVSRTVTNGRASDGATYAFIKRRKNHNGPMCVRLDRTHPHGTSKKQRLAERRAQQKAV
jgi:hypothetical protein